MAATLLAAAGVDAAAGAVFVFVAWRLARRPVSRGASRPARMFALWWAALGAYTFTGAALNLAGWAGATDLGAFVAARAATLVLACAAFAGLMHYLVFLYTGRDALRPIAASYGALCAATIAIVLASRPVGVDVQAWRTDLVYAGAVSTAVLVASLVVFLGPPIACLLAYLRLLPRLTEPAQRWRVGVVAPAMLVWLVGTFLARAAQDGWLQLWLRPVLGLAVAAVVLLAYAPPAALRARLGLAPPVEEVRAAPPPPPFADPPPAADDRPAPELRRRAP